MPNSEFHAFTLTDPNIYTSLTKICPDGFATEYKEQIIVANRWERLTAAVSHIEGADINRLPVVVLVETNR